MPGLVSKITQTHVPQITLKRSVFTQGIGVHSGVLGRVWIHPAPAHFGFQFRTQKKIIPANWRYITKTQGATVLSHDGISIQTTEHVLGALAGLGYHNALIEIRGPEIPILDGSAKIWVDILKQAGRLTSQQPSWAWKLNKPLWIQNTQIAQQKAFLEPSEKIHLKTQISHPVPLGKAYWQSDFETLIAPARTYVQVYDCSRLQKRGLLKGAGLNCGVLLSGNDPINTAWRLESECARHKILDALGDLILLGAPLFARINLVNNTHQFHRHIMKRLMQ